MDIFDKVNNLLLEETINTSKTSNKKKIGYTCSFIPPEIIYAVGLVPVRMLQNASTSQVSVGDTYMQRNTCPFVRGCIGKIAGGDFGYIDGIIGAHTCDNMRGMIENIEYFDFPLPLVYQIDVPRNSVRKNNINYFSNQLKEMIPLLEKISGRKFSESSFTAALLLYNRLRKHLKQIYAAVCTRITPLNERMVFQLIHHIMTTDPFPYMTTIEDLETACLSADEEKNSAQIRVGLMGSLLPKDHYRLFEIAESNHIRIFDDFICTGSKFLEQDIKYKAGEDAVAMLAKNYLQSTACSRMYNDASKQKRLNAKLDGEYLDGVVFLALKFCDSMLYEAAHVRDLCRQQNLPFLYIETELTEQDHGQVKTRLEAFFENLKYRN